MRYRLGIDLGTNSLGWAAVALTSIDPDAETPGPLLDMGVRIFSDARNPKDKSSNAAQRRGPRGLRRNRDRKQMRQRSMLRALVQAGLFPDSEIDQKALEHFDPWCLRARALDEPLSAHEIGRALFHLQQRRGFKSNRKTDGDEAGAMFEAIEKARDKMAEANARTLGELFGARRLEVIQENKNGERRPLPQARVRAGKDGSKMAYDYYPDRAMILSEFDQIWSAQAQHHPDIMTQAAYEDIRSVISFQRPLKPQQPGKCTFEEGEPRAPKALPSAQLARILQEVNNLRVGAIGENPRLLTEEERGKLVSFLAKPSNQTAKRTFKAIKRELSLPESQVFSLESARRDHLVGDLTAAKMMQEKAYGKDWLDLQLDTQDAIVSRLLEAEQPDDFVPWIMKELGVREELASRLFWTSLPDAHGKLSALALSKIIPLMGQGMGYDEAAKATYGDHRSLGDGVIYEEGLPYYGQVLSRHTAFEKPEPANDEEKFGRVGNPTVHVALNELGKVINDLIKRWGPPTEVVLELARNLPLSDRGLRELDAEQAKNQKANDKRREKLEKQSVADTYQNRLKLRLYEEALDAFEGVALCVFSGKKISLRELFTDAFEVEHILPLSKTLDDTISNKVLATREANRIKGNRTPFEAFGSDTEEYNWEKIAQRAAQLPKSKAWRFAPEAMARWAERSGDFLARQLNDTRYIARLGKSYVEALYGGQGAKGQENQVWVVPGKLTADLRHHAGFNTLVGLTGGNRKDRTDHRHHAVDALIVALTDRAMVKRAADMEKQSDKPDFQDILTEMAEPLKRYRASAEDRLSKLVVSHKPDHGFQDAMHNDTAFGLTGQKDARGQATLKTRKPVSSLVKSADLDAILDDDIRGRFQRATQGLTGAQFAEAIAIESKAQHPPIYSVRIQTVMSPSSFVVIRHGKDGEHAKAYKGDGNYCYDIFADARGRWTGEVITTHQAYQYARQDREWWRKPVRPDGSPLIMRLRKGDMLEIDGVAGGRVKVVIYKFSNGKLNMAEHYEANASARVRSRELTSIQKSPGSLESAKAVRLSVSPSGKLSRHKA